MADRWQSIGLSGGGGTETPVISPHDPNLILINCDMSGAYRSTDGGVTWAMLPWQQLTGCPFCAPVFHPTDANVVFAAYSYAATLRVSRDRGLTWTPWGRGLPGNLRWLAIDDGDPEFMLAVANGLVYRSADGGVSWTATGAQVGEPRGLHVAQNSPPGRRVCLAAGAEALWRSTDGGVTWRRVTGALPQRPLAAFAGGSNAASGQCLLYVWLDGAAPAGSAAPPGTVWRSADYGDTWTQVAEMAVKPGYEGVLHTLLTTNVQPATVYAIKPCYTADDTVWRSDDAGATWRSLAFADKTDPRYNLGDNYITTHFLPRSLWGWTTCGAAINPRHPEQVLFNHYCSIFITSDGGRTWRNAEVHAVPGTGDVQTPIAQRRWHNNGLVNTNAWRYYLDPFERQRHYIAYTDVGLARSRDAGQTWTWGRDAGANTYELAFDPAVPGRVWAAFSSVHDIPNNNIVLALHEASGRGCVGYGEDFGVTWRGLCDGLPGGSATELYDWSFPGRLEAPVVSVILDPRSPSNARRLYAAIWEHGVYCSEDGGRQWAKRAAGLGAPGVNVRTCRLHLHADGTLFCLLTGKMVDGRLTRQGVGLYASRDEGRSWRELTAGLDVRWLTDYDVDPRDSGVIYLAVCDDPAGNRAEGGLYGTHDGGVAWRRLARFSSLHFGATICPQAPDRVYLTLAYNQGAAPPLWLSRDRGDTWAPFDDYPFCSAHRVTFVPDDPAHVYVTSYGGGVWYGPAEP